MYQWAESWLVKFNANKSEALLISRKTNRPLHPQLLMNNEPIKEVSYHKHLGIFLSSDGTWHDHINSITSKAWLRVNLMRKLKFLLDRKSLGNYIRIFHTTTFGVCGCRVGQLHII